MQQPVGSPGCLYIDYIEHKTQVQIYRNIPKYTKYKYILAVQALEQLSDKALPEWAAFAATLARRLAELLPVQRVALGDPIWKACIDHFLLKAVDIDSQVSAV